MRRSKGRSWKTFSIGLIVGVWLLAGDLGTTAAQGSEPRFDYTIEKNVMIPMRDGVRLAADLYLPKGTGPFPVIVERTPYDKTGPVSAAASNPTYYAARGYAVVVQDVRGRYASEGAFYPFQTDAQDGYDTVEWAAVQPWSNGKICTIGGSYTGMTQYLLAPTRPPHLVCMFVREAVSDLQEEWVHPGGAFLLALNQAWALTFMAPDQVKRLPQADRDRLTAELEKLRPQWNRTYTFLPLNEVPVLKELRWYQDWLTHPTDDPYWWPFAIVRQHDQIDVPIYHLGGWYDIFQRGTLVNFSGITQRGRTEQARRSQKLLMGPWVHGPRNVGKTQVGDVDFGPQAETDFYGLMLRWFDYWLKGIENGIMEEPPVKLFVMGENVWRFEHEWPLARTKYTNYYLRSGPSDSTYSLNDGSLSLDAPVETERSDTYIYDPRTPTPTIGGLN
ncbi:MAG: CocE/NonD family hydrolase, partial [candidate division NC10 bacterium]|nr:CocE/NonD family hydrolase [candidate division NC10 bacterium]